MLFRSAQFYLLLKMSNSLTQANIVELSKTAFFLCDIQEKFRPAISHFTEIVEVAKRLVSASKILDVPLVVTEQYPKGLGATVADLEISHAQLKIEKTRFTMFCQEVKDFLESRSIRTVVLFGVEAHVCVLQTAIDLLNSGYQVHLVADATSSRSATDRLFAFDRLRQAGCVVTTYESVLFQLINDKNHEKFKEIQNLVKTQAPDTGLLHRSSSI